MNNRKKALIIKYVIYTLFLITIIVFFYFISDNLLIDKNKAFLNNLAKHKIEIWENKKDIKLKPVSEKEFKNENKNITIQKKTFIIQDNNKIFDLDK